MPNIIQAEFFHVGGAGISTLEQLMEECAERIAENSVFALRGIESRSGIKTVVRFFDESGTLSKLADTAARHQSRERGLFNDRAVATGLRSYVIDIHMRCLRCKIAGGKEEIMRTAIASLQAALLGGCEVAIERPDHSFRLVTPAERHELLESASKAKALWLFVFAPNDLLSDTNTSVAYVM